MPVVLILVAILAVPAAASDGKGITEEPIQVSAFPPDFRFGGPGGVSTLGTAAPNEVSVAVDSASGRYLVHDPDGAVPRTAIEPYRCANVDATTVSCPKHGPQVAVRMLKGADSFIPRAGLTGPIVGTTGAGADRAVLTRDYPGRLFVRAGGGADRLAGGSADDRLVGQAGPDRLRGRTGEDRIYGEHGADRAQGGPGDDRLVMNQNDRDAVIDCGSGSDLAVIDRNVDPDPQDCERVKAR